MKIMTNPAVSRKIPIPPCLGPPARKTATNSATSNRVKASNERSRPEGRPEEAVESDRVTERKGAEKGDLRATGIGSTISHSERTSKRRLQLKKDQSNQKANNR
jgi:hypothetical protein